MWATRIAEVVRALVALVVNLSTIGTEFLRQAAVAIDDLADGLVEGQTPMSMTTASWAERIAEAARTATTLTVETVTIVTDLAVMTTTALDNFANGLEQNIKQKK